MADLPRGGGEEERGDAAFERIARLAARALDAPIALIALPDQEGRFRTWSAGCVSAPVEAEPEGCFTWALHPAPDSDRTVPLALTASSRQPDVSMHHVSRPVPAGAPERAGVICIADWEPRAWTREETTLLHDLAVLLEEEIEFRGERRARQAAERRLVVAEQTKGQLAAALRHEFKQPLTVIQGFSELLGDGSLSPEEIREYALEINKEAAHLSRILGSLRNVDETIPECAAGRSLSSWPESSS